MLVLCWLTCSIWRCGTVGWILIWLNTEWRPRVNWCRFPFGSLLSPSSPIYSRDFLFYHNIPFTFVFHVRTGVFCCCFFARWKCSKNMMGMFLKKNIINNQIKHHLFFKNQSHAFCVSKECSRQFHLHVALHIPLLLCCVLAIISLWQWAKPTTYFEGLLLWILRIDPIFQEEALLILTTVVISFCFDSGVAMVSLEKKIDRSEQ